MANLGEAATQEPKCPYDIFISFRGEDTRHSFTGFLYDALRRKGFHIFLDDVRLQGGHQIKPSLDKAIQESRISIVVFSQNYASSSWCLDELVNILHCMETNNQLVWPIFYKVEPSDVRHQRHAYAEAMDKHENRFGKDSEKVHKWRSALFKVANLKGWHFQTGYEFEFIQMIVELATAKLHREQLYVGEHVIGHESHIEEVKLLLDIKSSNTVCMVGIHGTGGIGKTTLAKALYNSIVHQFECATFVEGVRESSNSYMGLLHLQEAILSKLFEGESIKLSSIGEGAARLRDRLCHRRVLLVLDDVDSEDQLEKLAGDCNWFGSGSRVIITTRDKHMLNVHQVEKRYEMKGLNDNEALQLFCWKAFKMSHPETNYEEVSSRAVRYANGLPLALKVIGSNLVSKSIEECECALKQYERIPERKIQDILKISYDCLEDNAKYVFLDIACFFKGERQEYVEKVMEKCNFFPAYNIGVLVNKSLLTIEGNRLRMHDLIQHMGREIVRKEAPSKPGERSRLYFHEDVLEVLTENLGSNNIEGIILDPPKQEEVKWSGIAFEKMNNLRILIVRNARFSLAPNYLPNSLRLLDWKGYPSESLPNYPRNAVVLSLPDSCLRLEQEKPLPMLVNLTHIDFSGCEYITHMPDVSGVRNLRKLYLTSCENLVAIHQSVGFLKKLEILNVSFCTMLRTLFPRIWLPSLQHFNLTFTRIKFFPDIEGMMDEPLKIFLMGTRIKKLPHSVVNLTGLTSIQMASCTSLRDLPSNLFMWPKIANLVLEDGGLTDEDLHFILSSFPNLEELEVPRNNFVSLPSIIKESANLRVLNVSGCTNLQHIPELPLNIQQVIAAQCPSLTSETSRMLWSQAFKEVYKLEVVMPQAKTQFPDWFDHHCKGGIVSFWACQKFPVIALAFVFKKKRSTLEKDSVPINLYINGLHVFHYTTDYCVYFDNFVGDQVLLCDLRRLFNGEDNQELPILDTFLVSEWNYIEVKCDLPRYLTVSYCGAYVYKQETNMEDIRFTCPNPLKRTLSIVDNLPKKRLRKLKLKSGVTKDNRKARRRSTQFQTLSSHRRIKKIVLPTSKCFWRYLSYGFS